MENSLIFFRDLVVLVLCIALAGGANVGCADAESTSETAGWSVGRDAGADGRTNDVPEPRRIEAECGDLSVALTIPDRSRIQRAKECADSTHGRAESVARSPRRYPNLEQLALTVTDEVVAPSEVYARVALDVLAIRDAYPELRYVKYNTLRTRPNTRMPIEVRIDDELRNRIRGGRAPKKWNCLNTYYGYSWDEDLAEFGHGTGRTRGIYRPDDVLEDYEGLPGVKDTFSQDEPDYRGPRIVPTMCAEVRGDTYHYVITANAPPKPNAEEELIHFYFTSDAPGCIERRAAYPKLSDEPRPEWIRICPHLHEP